MKFVYRIGKNPKNDLVLNERTADEFHAILELSESDELIVSDLNSKYGTFVSTKKIKSHILQPDEKLQIGFTTIDWPAIEVLLLKSKISTKPLPSNELLESKPEIENPSSENRSFSEPVLPPETDPIKQENPIEIQELKRTELGISEVTDYQEQEPLKTEPTSHKFTPKVIVVNTSIESQSTAVKSPDSDRMLYLLLVIILAGMMLLGWFIGKVSEL